MEIEKLQAKNGQEILKINNLFLHSKYDPTKESNQIIKENYKKDYLTIFFGYGAGHLIKSFESIKSKEDKFLIIEPILEDIQGNYSIFYLRQHNKHNLIHYFLKNISATDRINVILSPNYDKIVPELYLDLLRSIKEVQLLFSANEATINNFKGVWDRNYLTNLIYSVEDFSIKELEKKYSCPIVIASAGPSLTKQLKILKQYRNKIILISAGSAINSLLMEKIEPDYAVSIDGGDINLKHYQHLKLKNTHLIYELFNNPKIRHKFKTSYYFISSLYKKLDTHFKMVTEEEPSYILGGGSVATFCLSIAHYITTGPIALIGQDLAYTNSQTHAVGNKLIKEVDDNFKSSKKVTIETGYYGDKVETSYDLIAMKRVFEQLIQLYDKERIYNCTEGGIKLTDYKQISFKEFCNLYLIGDSVKMIEFNKEKSAINTKYEKVYQKIKLEIRNCEELIKLCDKGVKTLKSNALKDSYSQKTLKKLDEIDKKIMMFSEKTGVSITLESINIATEKYFKAKSNESRVEEFNRINTKSEFLYTNMARAVEEYQAILENDILKLIEEKVELK